MKKLRQNPKSRSGSSKGHVDATSETGKGVEGPKPAPPGRLGNGFLSSIGSSIGINNKSHSYAAGSRDSSEGDGGGRESGGSREFGIGKGGVGKSGGSKASGSRENGRHRSSSASSTGPRPHTRDHSHTGHATITYVPMSQYMETMALYQQEARQQSIRSQAVDEAHAEERRELDKQIAELESEIASLIAQHEHEKKQLVAQHEHEIAACEDRHSEALAKQHAENERTIEDIIDSHEREIEFYKAKVRELASDLISQSDDFRPATDQGLSMKLLDLRNRIKNITLPSNLQIKSVDSDTVSATGILQLPAELDPTDFMARHGSREIQYLLRSLVWKALVEAFFSSPFGFGFLGSSAHGSAGGQLLLDIHRGWSRLYGGGSSQHQHLYRGNELGMYSHDPYANKMRSALFQSFLPAVYPKKALRNRHPNGSQQDLHQGLHHQLPQHPLHPTVPEVATSNDVGVDLGVAVLYRQHCDNVVATIRQLLDRITHNNTRPDALEAVSTIVRLAAELGLECGVQRAQIWLVAPQPNETVTVGAEYADCLGGGGGDGDRDGGREVQVDLMVSPGIVRIGDGRRDMTVRKALVPCEVFPFMEDEY